MKGNTTMKRFMFVALLLLSLCLVVSCGDNAQTDVDSSDAATTEAIVTDPPVNDIVFIGGDVKYTVIRPESTDDVTRTTFAELCAELTKLGELGIGTDWLRKGDPVPEYEILFGDVDREEAKASVDEVPYCGFLIKVVGKKLVILTTNSDYVDEASAHLLGLCTETGLSLPENYSYVGDFKEGGYPLKDAKLGGTPLSEYEISSAKPDMAKTLQKLIGEQTGYRLVISSEENGAPKLIIGKSAKDNPAPLNYYDYIIESKDKNVYFSGYGENELGHSLKAFVNLIAATSGHDVALTETLDSYTLPAREEYINDITKLYMLWDYLWEAPEWMLDYESKKADMFGGNGSQKLYASAHRAELTFYPENSIEAVISTYYMGAAIAELDFGATADGVLVLMHDNTLSRTTNASEFVGKPGYPNSYHVSAWTYEQLKSLNLKEGGGGDNAKLTPFKIPTLEEALTVCKDRLFIVPDKYDNWQYVKSTDVMQGSKQLYLVDAMKKTGNYESILISYGNSGSSKYLSATDCVKLQKLLKAETGVTPFIMMRCSPSAANGNYNYFERNAEPQSFALQLNGDLNKNTDYATAYDALGDKLTFLAWTIGTGTKHNDFRANWEWMYNKGLRIIMTNDLFGLCKYCAEIGETVSAS